MKTIITIILSLLFTSCIIEEETVLKIDKWEDGIVYYNYQDEFTQKEKKIIEDCMKEWTAKTNIIFTEKKDQEYSVNILRSINTNNYKSIIGRSKNSFMQLGNVNIYTKKCITHELGHVLGLTHEHQRPDRDDYVIINFENILEGFQNNFQILDNPLYREESLEYDYSSIMHYDYYTCSNGDGPSLEILNSKKELNYSSKPSELDIQKIYIIYGK